MSELKDINIMFCYKCDWKITNPTMAQKTNTCPKCGSLTFEISQYYYYKKGKLISGEFELTDNDEVSFSADSWKNAKKICEKAFGLIEKEYSKKITPSKEVKKKGWGRSYGYGAEIKQIAKENKNE